MNTQEPSSNIFKIIFESAPEGIAVLGKSGILLYGNKAFYALFDVDPEKIKDQSLATIIQTGDVEKYEQNLQKLVSGEQDTISMELRSEVQTHVSWIQINASAVQYPWRDDSFIVCTIENISIRKIDEENLKTAKDEAEKATRIKSDFLANMSHEIRTPLHTIIGMTELLSETNLDAEQAEYATQVAFSADVLLSLINDILDFSKIEAGKLSLESIDFDLHKVVEDSVDLVALEAHKKGLEVLIDIKKDTPRYLIGDPVRVRQIVLNLFNNAMKFTSSGEIEIALALNELKDDNAEIKISVRDTGIGIPPERKERLFRVFSQIDSSTTRKYGGSGLGLSICKNLVQLMGGTIGVDSEVGKGSEFWFVIPLVLSGGEYARVSVDRPFPEVSSAVVVDDNAASRAILESYLANWGLEVSACSTGDDALEFLRERSQNGNPVDICLIDLLMPKMDGWHLASEINSDKKINDIKLFLMSPTGKSADEAKMKLLNWFDGYISKPVKTNEFFDVLNRSLTTAVELEPLEELPDGMQDKAGIEFGAISGSILVAEDHEVNQRLFKMILENMGFRVKLASNGREAVEYADSDVRLIFMDVQMPEMNGYEATKAIRERGIDVPIIAVTASAIKGERDKALEIGMTDFLTKPFKKNDILPVLRKWVLAEKSSGAAVEEKAESTESLPIFDFEDAVETFMGNKETVIDLVKTIIEKIENQIPAIREAFEKSDFEVVRAEAHSIKGGCLNLSVQKLGTAAADLEAAAKQGLSEEIPALIDSVNEAFEEFKTHIEKQSL